MSQSFETMYKNAAFMLEKDIQSKQKELMRTFKSMIDDKDRYL